MGEATRTGRTSEWAETWEKWRGLILFAVIGGGIFAASRFDASRPWAGLVVAMAFPIGAVVMGYTPLREAAGTLKLASIAVLGLAAAAADIEMAQVFFPGEPLAAVTLREGGSDAQVSWPGANQAVGIDVHGELRSARGAGQGTYTLVVTRGRAEETIAGTISRTVSQGRRAMRRMAPTSSVTKHLTDHHELTLAGSGRAKLHLESVDGLLPSVRVTLREPPAMDRWLIIALGLLVVAATAVQAAAKKAGYSAKLAAAVGATAVLGWYVVHRFDPDDPFTTVAGGALVAVVAGGLGGLLLGGIVSSFVSPPPPPPAPPKPGRRGAAAPAAGEAG